MTYNLRYSDYSVPVFPAPVPWTGPPDPPISLTLPYVRTSPAQIPRRDLVFGQADSLFLRVTVVESDLPDAPGITLTAGIGGPTLQMLVWPDTYYPTSWDYGAWPHSPQSLLWSGMGIATGTAAPSAFDIAFPAATMSSWPRRCAYALQLGWGGGPGASLLAIGRLHLAYATASSVGGPAVIMLTDPTPPVLTDDSQDFILLNGAMPT